MRFAKHKGFFHVGRGSGANSLVAYCLGITDVDPIELDLYFERFINPSRSSPPDFDLDFSWKDRDQVTQYLFDRYGEGRRVALLATYSTYQYRGVIRELGKVLTRHHDIDALADPHTPKKDSELDQVARTIMRYSQHLHEHPHHLSIHVAGAHQRGTAYLLHGAAHAPQRLLDHAVQHAGGRGPGAVQVRYPQSARVGAHTRCGGDGGGPGRE